ncbi:hypothetical protein ACWC4J_44380, partial [Streptomyces sp. NPDC001356]
WARIAGTPAGPVVATVSVSDSAPRTQAPAQCAPSAARSRPGGGVRLRPRRPAGPRPGSRPLLAGEHLDAGDRSPDG